MYQERTGVPHWPFASCHQGCLARSYLSVSHDHSDPVFSQTGTSNLPKFRILPGSSVVLQFLSSWHNIYFWLFHGMSASPGLKVTSHASGSLGFGAYFNMEWFSGSWVSSQASHYEAYKELFPVVIADHVWDPQFARHHVLFHSHNEARQRLTPIFLP